MSDQPSLADELLDEPSDTVLVGDVVNNGTSQPAWQPQTEPPAQKTTKPKRPRSTASLKGGIMKILGKLKTQKSSSPRTQAASQPSTPDPAPAPNVPSKGVVIGHKLLRGSLSTGSFVRRALIELDFFDTMLAVTFLVIYDAAYQETKPQGSDILVGMVGGSIAIGLLLILSHTVCRLSSQSGRRTFLRMTGAAILVLLAIAIIASAYVYYPLYVPGMMIVAVGLMLFAGPFAWVNNLGERQAFKAKCKAEAEQAANERVDGVIAKLKTAQIDAVNYARYFGDEVIPKFQLAADTVNTNIDKVGATLTQAEALESQSEANLVRIKTRREDFDQSVKKEVDEREKQHIDAWTADAENTYAAQVEQQIKTAVDAAEAVKNGVIAQLQLQLQQGATLLRNAHASLEQASTEKQALEQRIAGLESVQSELEGEKQNLQNRLREASYGPATPAPHSQDPLVMTRTD